ncbi:hypothetical protein [Solimonas marina]|uniref:Uncharacterized protein n=1 Tax=Solimonas marina TaxID=2714601 RepID=A0A969WCM9_9GAMM|nr:hypothetical protein [Solimonas marina]NKF22966.1 hypothetical protein [Solimonas marina]
MDEPELEETRLIRASSVETASAWGHVLLSVQADTGETIGCMLDEALASKLLHGLAVQIDYLSGLKRDP